MMTSNLRFVPTLIFGGLSVWVLIRAQTLSTVAAIFPTFVGGVMLILSISLLVMQICGRGPAKIQGEFSEENWGGSNYRRAMFIAIMVIWTLLIPWIGFLTISAIAVVAITLVATHEKAPFHTIVLRVAISFMVILSFYILFSQVLHIPLPKGMMI